MLQEKFNKAQQLQVQIEDCKKDLEMWEQATSFITLYCYVKTVNGSVSKEMPKQYIPYPVIRCIVLQHYREELQRLETEFATL
jgi:hypothetical protein